MKLLSQYFELQEKIYNHFGYKENWVTIPLRDETDSYWFVSQVPGDGGGCCVWSNFPLTKESIKAGEEIYSGSIYTQRFLPKWVYRADDFTMVCVDTNTDGNKFLMVFDNTKECTDDGLIKLYKQCW